MTLGSEPTTNVTRTGFKPHRRLANERPPTPRLRRGLAVALARRRTRVSPRDPPSHRRIDRCYSEAGRPKEDASERSEASHAEAGRGGRVPGCLELTTLR